MAYERETLKELHETALCRYVQLSDKHASAVRRHKQLISCNGREDGNIFLTAPRVEEIEAPNAILKPPSDPLKCFIA
jgi:hypothetical protein